MPRTRIPPAERLAQLQHALIEKDTLRAIRAHPSWEHFLNIFDTMLDLSESRFRHEKESPEQHRAYLTVIETVRALVEDSEEHVPKLIEEIGALDEHLQRQRAQRAPTLPGS